MSIVYCHDCDIHVDLDIDDEHISWDHTGEEICWTVFETIDVEDAEELFQEAYLTNKGFEQAKLSVWDWIDMIEGIQEYDAIFTITLGE